MARSVGPIYIADNSVVAINDALQQLMFLIDEVRGEHDNSTIPVGPHTHAGLTGPQGAPGQDGGPITIEPGTIDHDDLANVTSDQHHNKLHSATHGPGGVDALKLDDLAAPDDNTDLNSSATAHGLLIKLANDGSKFLDGTGAWSTPVVVGSEARDVEMLDAGASTVDFERHDSPTGELLGFKWAYKRSTETKTTNVVPALDAELFVDLPANSKWLLEFRLFVVTNTEGAGDLALGVAAPSGSVVLGGGIGLIPTATGNTTLNIFGNFSENSASSQAGLINDFGTSISVSAIVHVGSTPGNVGLYWCQNSSSGNQSSILLNSYMYAMKISE